MDTSYVIPPIEKEILLEELKKAYEELGKKIEQLKKSQ